MNKEIVCLSKQGIGLDVAFLQDISVYSVAFILHNSDKMTSHTNCEDFNFTKVHLIVDQRKLDNDVFEAHSTFVDMRAMDTDRGSVRYSARILTTQSVLPKNRCVLIRVVIS